MFAQERVNEVLKFISRRGSASVYELAEHFGVAPVTVRRDLKELERRGMIKRTHGGAISNESTLLESTLSERGQRCSAEKNAIGILAAGLIKPGETVILDAGTTTLEVARALRGISVTVLTNGLNVALELSARPEIEVVLIGGSLRRMGLATVGSIAEDTVSEFRVDKTVLGVSALMIPDGMFTANTVEARTKRAMIKVAREVIIVSDYSKIGKTAFALVSDLSCVNKLVTDDKINSEHVRALESMGIEVMIASAGMQ